VGATLTLFVYSFSLPTDWFVRVNEQSAGTVESGGLLTQVVFLSFLGMALLGLNGNWHVALLAARSEPLIPALIGLAVFSSVWATSFAGTLQDAVVLAITYVIALYFVVRFSVAELLRYCGTSLAVGVLINFIFIFVFQEFGLDTINVATDGGAKWSGVFVTKNELGRIAVLSVLVFGFLVRLRRSMFVWPAFTILGLIQVVASDSATSLGAMAGIIGLTTVFLGFRGRKTLYGATALALTTVFATLTLLAATSLAAATGLLGKDATFTGRLPLWVNSFQHGIGERLWTGYGWLGFWGDTRASFDVRVRSNFSIPHAHNAFIDTWLYVGPLGAILLLAIFIRGLVWGARNVRADLSPTGLFPILVVSNSLIFSLTEAGVVRRDISFILFVVAVVLAARQKGIPRPFVPLPPTDDDGLGNP
jgi:O-antigen ligase